VGTRNAASSRITEGEMKATELLEQQHREVEKLFKRALRADDPEGRRELCEEISDALRIHTSLEEDIFYPAFRQEADSKKAEKLVLEAYEEHHVVELVLNELPELDPAAENYEAKLTVLQELIDHHVEIEEDEMFPAAERAFGKERSQHFAEQMQSRIGGEEAGQAHEDEDRGVRELDDESEEGFDEDDEPDPTRDELR
jgi:hemerythrin-like domain-containing protein